MKTPDYLSYERYKKKKNSNPNKRVSIFIATFFATLLIFTIVAKSLSPDVDVTIGDETQTEAKDTGLGVKKFIDERLKMIQMDDNSSGVSTSAKDENPKINKYNEETYDKAEQPIVDEKVTLPTRQDIDNSEINEAPVAKPVKSNTSVKNNPPRPTSRDLNTSYSNGTSTKVSKVYVGRYSTLEQAKVAQEILMDSGLGITPFIRDMGSSYTLQIGSYSSKAKADGLASELQRNSFPARVVQE